MRPTVYIETTIVSYLTARPSRDLLRLAQQRTTVEWWESTRSTFDLYCSELVHLEAAAGDRMAAAERLNALADIPILDINTAAIELGQTLVTRHAFPAKAERDALHVAICAVHGIDYLLTWNFKHLANAVLRNTIVEVCETSGYVAPVICAPSELEHTP